MDIRKSGSADSHSKEIIGRLETNSFTIPKSGSTLIPPQKRPSFENNLTDVNSWSNKSLLSYEKHENYESETKLQSSKSKSVSFRIQDAQVSKDIDTLSDHSYISFANSATGNEVLQNRTSFSSTNSLKSGTTTSRRNIPIQILENIAEVDENVSEDEAAPGYYGWDGYEARFEESMADGDSWSSIPGCIPPWAKTVGKKYGLSQMESFDEDQVSESKRTRQEKLENLMKKHKELMLLKRVESKKQLIVEPNKDPNELDTIKMRAKSTRYYMAPLVLEGTKRSTDHIDENKKISLPSLSDSNSLSLTNKTSRPQAKKETSQFLKSLKNSASKKKDAKKDHEYQVKKENDKCPKITLSNIREFVNMTPDERKLHEIIKIEKVPSVQDLKERGKPSSKYIINVPKNTITDQSTVNVIKIKEKRKLRVNSIENIEEKVTELHYNHGETRRHAKRDSDYTYRESYDTEPRRHIKTTTRSPTETKTFEVKTKQTPFLAPLVEDKKTEKVLLLQYDKKSKKDKHTTQFLGIKETCSSEPGEMYLYGAESEGQRVKEHLKAAQEIPLTLKDKVHSVFEELRGLTLKQNIPVDMRAAEVQAFPSVDTKETQRPSYFLESTELTKPEVRSTAVQVRQSQILEGKYDSPMLLVTPYTTPTSDFPGKEEIRFTLDKEILQEKLEDLVLDEGPSEKPISIDEVTKYDMGVKQESLKESQETIEEDKPKSDKESLKAIKEDKPKSDEESLKAIEEDKLKPDKESLTAEVEKEPQVIKPDGSEIETIKQEEEKTKLDDEIIVDQSGVEEILEKISDQTLTEKEIISEDDIKKTSEQAQKDTHSEVSKRFSKVISRETLKKLSKERSKEPIAQIQEENEMRKLSKTSPTNSGQLSISQLPQDTEIKTIHTVVSDEIKVPSRKTDDNEGSEKFYKTSFSKEYEDIRSYEFGSQQGTELVIQSPSKFLHKKDSLRKSKYKIIFFGKNINILSKHKTFLYLKSKKLMKNTHFYFNWLIIKS